MSVRLLAPFFRFGQKIDSGNAFLVHSVDYLGVLFEFFLMVFCLNKNSVLEIRFIVKAFIW